MRRALVVGGTGFVGLAVVDELLARGTEVLVTRRKRSITALVRKRNVRLVEASLDDGAALTEAMRGVDAVFMAAGYYPRYSLDREGAVRAGVSGVRVACEAALAAEVRRFVYTSSTGALAPRTDGNPLDEDDIPSTSPRDSVYRAVKWEMEREIERYASRGLQAVTMIPGGCLGPGDVRLGTGGVLVATVRRALPWFVDGTVPMVDVGDVAHAHVEAAVASSPSSRYCLGGNAVRVRALLATIAARYGGAMPREELEVEAARARANAEERAAAPSNARVFFPRELVDLIAAGQPVSSARAVRELGVRHTPLDATLDRAHAWFASNGFLGPKTTTETA